MTQDALSPPSGTRPPRRVRRLLARFRRDKKGATAVEFGLVALPFFAMLFAIMETALVFWSTQVLETAVADASRRIYTGQFQSDNAAVTDPVQLAQRFKQDVCANVQALFDCNGMLNIDVRTYTSFPAGVPRPVDGSGNFDPSSFGYQPPGPNQIVVVRAALAYPAYMAIMNPTQTLPNGRRLIMASATFRTEPFSN